MLSRVFSRGGGISLPSRFEPSTPCSTLVTWQALCWACGSATWRTPSLVGDLEHLTLLLRAHTCAKGVWPGRGRSIHWCASCAPPALIIQPS